MPNHAPRSSNSSPDESVERAACSPGAEWISSGAEVGLGAAILAVRRFNVWRRDLASSAPPVADLVDSTVESLAETATAASVGVRSVLDVSADSLPEPARGAVNSLSEVVGAVPDLLRISGLAATE